MADVTFDVQFTENGTPVLKNIKQAAEQAMTGVQKAVQQANGALNDLGKEMTAAGQGMKKADNAGAHLGQTKRELGSAVRFAAGELGALGPIGGQAANVMLQLDQGISRATLAASAAVIGISAMAAALRHAADEEKAFDDALRAKNIDFFIRKQEELNAVLERRQSAGILRRSGQFVSDLFTGQPALNAPVRGELDAVNKSLDQLKTEKVQDLAKEFQHAGDVARANNIGRILLEGAKGVDDMAKKLVDLGISGEKAQKVLSAVGAAARAQAGAAVRDYVRAIDDANNATRLQIVEFTKGADASDQEALRLANLKAAHEGVGKAAAAANQRLIESQRQLKDDQLVKSLGDQRDALAAQRKELVDGASASDDFRFSIMATNAELQAGTKDLTDIKNALAAYRAEQIALRAAQFNEQAKSLEAQVTGEVLSEVSGRIAAAKKEYDERTKLIDRWKEAMDRAGEDVTARANQLSTLALESLQNKIDPIAQLRQKFQHIDIESEILGPDFDTLQPKIAAVTDSLIDLIQRREDLADLSRRGFLADPAEIARTAAEIDLLKGKLEELRQAERVKQAIDNIAEGISSAFDRALTSTGSALERLKALAKDSIDSINRELTKLLVTDPLKDWLKKQLGGIFGQIGLPVPGAPGGAGAGNGAAEIAAIQATQTAATVAIQTTGTTAQAGLTTEATTGQTAIAATQTTATTAIEALKVEAIAAIQSAAAAARGGSIGGGGPLIPFSGLFGSNAESSYLNGALGTGAFSGVDLFEAHSGGLVGSTRFPTRVADPRIFAGAPRYGTGGMPGLKPGEVPVIAHKGERILNPQETRDYNNGKGGGAKTINVTMNLHGVKDAQSFQRSQRAIMKDLQRGIERGQN